MKKLLFILACTALAACHENYMERAQREAQDYTSKNCPQQLAGGIVYDSLVFSAADTTLYSYYTISGQGDSKAVVEQNSERLNSSLLENFRNDVRTQKFKEQGFSFGVVVHSQKNAGVELFRARFTSKDLL